MLWAARKGSVAWISGLLSGLSRGRLLASLVQPSLAHRKAI